MLTPQEVDQLLATLRRMADAGRGLVFISHKLHEVMAFADRITVMRDGVVTGEVLPENTSRQELADLMVGRPVKLVPDRTDRAPGDVALSVGGLTVVGDRAQTAVDDVSLDVRAGEVLGIAGVSGNGQRELAEAIAGLRPPQCRNDRDRWRRDRRHVTSAWSRRADWRMYRRNECATASIASFAVWENLMLLDHGRPPFARRGMLRRAAIRQHADRLVREFAVRTPGLDTPTRALVGRQHPEADHGARGVVGASGSCSPRSRPAASTSGPPSTSMPG